jgi:hypothetical protein
MLICLWPSLSLPFFFTCNCRISGSKRRANIPSVEEQRFKGYEKKNHGLGREEEKGKRQSNLIKEGGQETLIG